MCRIFFVKNLSGLGLDLGESFWIAMRRKVRNKGFNWVDQSTANPEVRTRRGERKFVHIHRFPVFPLMFSDSAFSWEFFQE